MLTTIMLNESMAIGVEKREILQTNVTCCIMV